MSSAEDILLRYKHIDSKVKICEIHEVPKLLHELDNIPNLDHIKRECCWSWVHLQKESIVCPADPVNCLMAKN